MPYIKGIKIPQGFDKGTFDAGRRACAQLVRAVSSETSAPLRRAAAASALARLHGLLIKDGHVTIAALRSIDDVRATVSALVEVYSVSLREVATFTATPGPSAASEDQAQLKESKDIPGAGTPKPHALGYGQQRPGSGNATRGAESGCSRAGGGAAAGHGAGPSPEDWVPLLVDSSALLVNFLNEGVYSITSTAAAAESIADFEPTEVYACNSPTLASALLLSDALPALSRLLSAEAQRGPARALLTPRQLATCLKPLNELITAAASLHDELLPVSPQGQRQRDPPAPNSPATATTTTTPAPSPVPPTPTPIPSTSIPPNAGPSTPAPAAAKLSKGAESCSKPPAAASVDPGGSASAPVPQERELSTRSTFPAPPTSQTLGPAVLRAVAESGVLEAACKLVVVAAEQVAGGRQQQQQQLQKGAACVAGGDREQLVAQLLELPRQLLTLLWCGEAGSLPEETLQAILAGPCVQVRVARQRGGNRPCMESQVCPCIRFHTNVTYVVFLPGSPSSFLCSRKRHAYAAATANGKLIALVLSLPLQFFLPRKPTLAPAPRRSTPWPPTRCPSCTPWTAVRRTACRTTACCRPYGRRARTHSRAMESDMHCTGGGKRAPAGAMSCPPAALRPATCSSCACGRRRWRQTAGGGATGCPRRRRQQAGRRGTAAGTAAGEARPLAAGDSPGKARRHSVLMRWRWGVSQACAARAVLQMLPEVCLNPANAPPSPCGL